MPIPADSIAGASFRSLWGFARTHAASDAKPGHNYTLLDVGLALHDPLLFGAGYKCDAENLLVFASTGGDGVHYGLLTDTELATDNTPVVMVVPMNWNAPHLIVGANLREFLDLGCCYGYFSLEQLVYDRAQTCKDIEAARHDQRHFDSEGCDLIGLLRKELGLKPWKSVSKRLEELNTTFLQQLRLPKQDA